MKGTEVGAGWKELSRLVGYQSPAGSVPGKYLVDESGEAELPDRFRDRRPVDQDRGRQPDQEVRPAAASTLRDLIDGIMTQKLPWGLVILGAVLAIVMQLAGVSAIAFAVGVYLPLSTTLPIFVGGISAGSSTAFATSRPEKPRQAPGH